MRIAYSFIIVLVTVFLWLLPITEMVYVFRTDPQTDSFTVETGSGVTSDNVTLDDFVYNDDDDTISVESSINEVPVVSSYNATSKTVLISSLTENTTRTLEVTYDVDVIMDNDAINNLLDRANWVWILIIIAFPVAGLAAIWTNRT